MVENMQTNLYWNIQYIGLQDLNKVQKKSQFGLELKMNNDNFKYEYNIDNNLEFKDNVSIDKFDDNSTVILNNYDSQVLTKFLTQVGQRISDVNKKQMEELGLEEDENPIIYSNPITSRVAMLSHGLDDTESLLDTEIESHNNKFLTYEGDNKRGTEVNLLMSTVALNNSNSLSDAEKVEVKLDGTTILSKDDKVVGTKVDTSKMYEVKMKYSASGYISEINITTAT